MASRRRPSPSIPFVAAVLVALPMTPVSAQTACAEPTGPADPPAVTGGNGALSAPQPGPAPMQAPQLCWVGATGNAVLGIRAVALGDRVVTFSDQNEVVAFPPDGAEVFRVPLGEPGQGTPGGLYTDGELVFAAATIGLVALDPADGSEVWSIPVDQRPIAGSTGAETPVAVGGFVYAVLNSAAGADNVDRWLIAVNAASGEENWRVSLDPTLPAGPVSADEERVTVWDGRGTLFMFDAADGTELWQVPVEDLGLPPAAQSTMADGTIVTALAGGEVAALSTEDGSERWRFVPPSGFASSVTIGGGSVYVDGETELYALDASDGSSLWTAAIQDVPAPFGYQPVPAVVDDLVILGTSDVDANAALVGYDAADGSERWRSPVEVFGAILSPIVTGGRVYAPVFDINLEGGLYAFGSPG